MKNKMLLAAILVLALLISGCERERRGFTLTEEEERLLCELYIDEESIKKGMLVEYQWKCLEQILFGREYLEEKYPGISFDFLDCEPKNKINKNTVIIFYETAEKERKKSYSLAIEKENGKYEGADNYYGKLIHADYDCAVTEKLVEAGFKDCAAYTDFWVLKGEDMDADVTSEELFAMGEDLNRSTDIFIDHEDDDAEENERITKNVEKVMRENNLHASYNVYIIPGILEICGDGEECEKYVRDNFMNPDIYSAGFNCFDLK